MLDSVLKIVLAGWIGIGAIVVAISFFFPAVTGKVKTWNFVICVIIVFLTGIAALTNFNAFIASQEETYNVSKGTADIVDFIRSKEPGAGHTIGIAIYTAFKYIVKIFCYESYMYLVALLLTLVFGGKKPERKILGKIFFWCLAMIYMINIVDVLNLNTEDYLLSEGYISVIIAAVVLLKSCLKAVYNTLFRREKGQPLTFYVVSACLFTLFSLLALHFDAWVWGQFDRWVFGL